MEAQQYFFSSVLAPSLSLTNHKLLYMCSDKSLTNEMQNLNEILSQFGINGGIYAY